MLSKNPMWMNMNCMHHLKHSSAMKHFVSLMVAVKFVATVLINHYNILIDFLFQSCFFMYKMVSMSIWRKISHAPKYTDILLLHLVRIQCADSCNCSIIRGLLILCYLYCIETHEKQLNVIYLLACLITYFYSPMFTYLLFMSIRITMIGAWGPSNQFLLWQDL